MYSGAEMHCLAESRHVPVQYRKSEYFTLSHCRTIAIHF